METVKKWLKAGGWILIILIILVLLTYIVNATYKPNNAFTQGDETNVFTGNCTYQNASNLDEYIDCDDSIECRMTAFFPNNTLIEAYRECSRTGNQFNYSFGYINDTGTYNTRAFLSGEKGWITKDFIFTISASSPPPGDTQGGTGSGGAVTQPQETYEEPQEAEVIITTEDKMDNVKEVMKQTFISVGGFVNKKNALTFGILMVLGGFSIIWFLWVKYGEKAKKKIEKKTIEEKRPYYQLYSLC